MIVTFDHIQEILRANGLEEAAKGVIFPFGVMIVEHEGRKMLRPATPDEYRLGYERETGKTLSEEELVYGGCGLSMGQCIHGDCKGRCVVGTYLNEGGWFCFCQT